MGLRRANVPLKPYSRESVFPWVWEHDLIGRRLLDGKIWDEPIVDLMNGFITRGSMFIDVGAHVGFYSLASLHLGAVCAAAYEPYLYNLLRINSAGLPIWAAGSALGSRSTWARWKSTPHAEFEGNYPEPLQVHGKGGLGGLHLVTALPDTPPPAYDLTAGLVRVSTLDRENEFNGWDASGIPISFIKIDAQGWDLRVMVGGEHTIRKHKPAITFEYEQDLSSDPFEEYVAFLNRLGYVVSKIAGLPNDYLAIPR